ncbi:hypothetical protein H4219_000242 [Mycoemilia scoparia]|uniref:Uncharacterized protein n=1 Tax=Mycoemilia scoparia TaxID=417184 RepID=A0A9W8DWR9_9FUNG|nr:hypothetical protein H4219_000242 [Mycoemilia scoparia]
MENVSLFTPLYVPEKDALDKLENSCNKTTDLSNIVNTLTKAGPNILSSRLGIFLENGLETNTDINSQTLPLLALKKINQPAVTVFGEAVFTRGLGKSASNSWTSSVFSSDSYLKLPHTFSTLSSPLQNTTSQYRNINEAKAVSVAALLKNSTEVESYISELCDSLDVKDKIYKQYDPDLIIQYKESLVALKDRYLLD